MTRKVTRIMKKRFAGILILVRLSGITPLVGQVLWPGDVNNNGIVNAVDLLYLGQAYGSAGPEREDATTDWQEQPIATPWASSFTNGLNYVYADCDGDGKVRDEDIENSIHPNFWKTHGEPQGDGYVNGTPGGAPRVHLTPAMTLVEEGAMIDINLSLGDPGFPISRFYGIALAFSYNPELLNPGSFDFDFEDDDDNWIIADGTRAEDIFKKDDANGKAHIGITRINHQPLGPGSGSVGNFSIVIEDIIVGLHIDTFRLQVDSIMLVDEQFATYALVPDTALIVVAKDKALVSVSGSVATPPVQVFPNPVSGSLYLLCPETLSGLHLFDALGRAFPMQSSRISPGTYQLIPQQAPPGIYWLVGHGKEYSFRKKIVIF